MNVDNNEELEDDKVQNFYIIFSVNNSTNHKVSILGIDFII